MVSKATRITGNKKIILQAAGIDRVQELKSLTIENDDASGDPTFAEAAGGAGRDYTVNGTYKQDSAADSFGRWIWANEGASVEVRYAPMGNDVPTVDAPHYTFTAQVGAPGTIGGDASFDGDEFDAEFTWKITSGKPVLDDGTDGKGVVSSVAPNGKTSGDSIVVSGRNFTAVTNVKFGNTQAKFFVINDSIIAVTIPTGVTGASNLTVVSPAGTSTAYAYTAAA